MDVLSVDPEPVSDLLYLNAAPRRGTEVRRLEIQRAHARGLPDGLDAIVATSDLQGVVPDPATGRSTLLGVAVAEHLAVLAEDGVLPSSARTGVVLAGDLYSVPAANERGGYGDVSEVWDAFAAFFSWVAGVAGNHDDVARVRAGERVNLLDGERVELDGLRVGGVGLIGGNPAKLGRRAEPDQLERIARLASRGLDVLVLHEGPGLDDAHPGHPDILRLVERHRVPLTICGHVHWDEPLARHREGQLLNVDARVLVLTRAE